MAVIIHGTGISDARGKVGGVVFSRSPAGAILRTRIKPCNPATTVQNTRRGMVAYLTRAWSSVLTVVMRQAWNDYAAGTPMTNKLGQPILVSGLSMFLRTNCLLKLAGAPLRTTAPNLVGQAAAPTFTCAPTVAGQLLVFSAADGGFEPGVENSCLFIFQSRPENWGRQSALSGYKYAGCKIGDIGNPTTIPFNIASLYVLALEQRVGVSCTVVDPIGRCSAPVDYTLDVVA